MGKIVELFGAIMIVAFVIVGMLAVAGFFFDGLHRVIISTVADNMFFVRKFVL